MKKKIAAWIASLMLLVVAVFGWSGSAQATGTATLCAAHRGGTEKAVENTLGAVRSSNAPWVETDVQFTRDGVPVIMHDSTIDRTTNGSGSVSSMTLWQLRQYRTADGQYVPTLYEFLKATGNRHVFVELKNPTLTQGQWAAFDARFNWLKAWNRTVVTSFFPSAVDGARSRGHVTGLIEDVGLAGTGNQYILAHGTYLLKNHNSVTAARVAQWHAAGIKVFGWTPDNRSEQLRMKWDHADGVITNKPNACMNTL